MLTEITALLRERGPMSLSDLAVHFRTEAGAIEGMLQTLEGKGRVRQVGGSTCAGCSRCALVRREDQVLYEVAPNPAVSAGSSPS